jgi:hypothetical protein
VFSTCLCCHASLGANESIEHFPVGRRLAFDGDRGRLWAICPHCHQWNLAPIEERWEAIEACERAYRGTPQRVFTDNIALARLKDGTDLVRIGRPLLPEFAAWRYGGEYVARHKREYGITIAGTAILAVGGVTQFVGARVLGAGLSQGSMSAWMIGGLGAGLTVLQWGGMLRGVARWALPRALVSASDDGALAVSNRDASRSRVRLHPDDGRLQLGVRARRVVLAPRALQRRGIPFVWTGATARETWHDETPALEILPRLLPTMFIAGADEGTVRSSVDVLVDRVHGRDGPPARAVAELLAQPELGAGRRGEYAHGRPLDAIPVTHRLAAEMALHEDDERRALAGELGALYARWEEAERVARIADGELTRLAQHE